MAAIKLPDGSVKQVPDGSTVMQLAESIGKGLARAAIVAKVDGKQVDLSYALNGSSSVQILTEKDPEALKVLRHSAAHVMAEAITRIWPDVKLAYGPPTENGFFYDVALDAPISSDDFQRIEGLMAEIVNQNRPFTRYELRASEALPKLKDEGNQYKSDNANRAIYEALGDPNPGQTVDLQMKLKHLDPFQFSDGVLEKLNKASLDPTLSFYVTGDNATIGTNPNATGRVLPRHAFWEDLCKGPHVPTTGKIRAFKVMSVSQSHWHGDINKDRFQRVYGTAFFENKQLEEYLRMLEEAKKRDHRVLGKQLGLFTISPLVGSGLILWMPKGAVLRYQLESFLREELTRRGYQEVYTPHIGNIELYKRSGHYPYYKESQFPPIHMAERTAPAAGHAADTDEFLLRPMNCPHHIQIFAAEPKSYRDLPVRLAEFGTVYRYEESGELSGLTRVRGFTQDDAHIFCTPEQVEAEFRSTVELVQFVFKSLHFADVEVRLSLRDPASAKFAGDPKLWDLAEAQLARVLTEMQLSYMAAKGEAAFYGPKVDFLVRDVLGRKWQLGTVQLDYVLPERFELEYVGPDGQKHRPVMIHRAPFGSIERFTGILIEHFGGAFPLWLAPVQVSVLSISEKFNAYAAEVLAALKGADLRCQADLSPEKIGAKIRDAAMQKIPYMLIVGEKEAAGQSVSVRTRGGGDQGQMSLAEFIERCQQEVATRGGAPATGAS